MAYAPWLSTIKDAIARSLSTIATRPSELQLNTARRIQHIALRRIRAKQECLRLRTEGRASTKMPINNENNDTLVTISRFDGVPRAVPMYHELGDFQLSPMCFSCAVAQQTAEMQPSVGFGENCKLRGRSSITSSRTPVGPCSGCTTCQPKILSSRYLLALEDGIAVPWKWENALLINWEDHQTIWSSGPKRKAWSYAAATCGSRTTVSRRHVPLRFMLLGCRIPPAGQSNGSRSRSQQF